MVGLFPEGWEAPTAGNREHLLATNNLHAAGATSTSVGNELDVVQTSFPKSILHHKPCLAPKGVAGF